MSASAQPPVKKSNRLQKVEDVPRPEVGRYYLVPCVELLNAGNWWPIIGPWHEDADIGTPRHHWHYDMRFLRENLWALGGNINMGRIYSVVSKPGFVLGLDDETKEPPVTYRRLKMLRPMPNFPSWRAEQVFLPQLEAQFRDHKLKCATCPHRGMSLENLTPDEQGHVVCHGHGLRWNLKTKRLAPFCKPIPPSRPSRASVKPGGPQ